MNSSVRRCRLFSPPPAAGRLTCRIVSPVLILVGAACLTGLAEKPASAQGSNLTTSGGVNDISIPSGHIVYMPPSPSNGQLSDGYWGYGTFYPGYGCTSYFGVSTTKTLHFYMQIEGTPTIDPATGQPRSVEFTGQVRASAGVPMLTSAASAGAQLKGADGSLVGIATASVPHALGNNQYALSQVGLVTFTGTAVPNSSQRVPFVLTVEVNSKR